MVMAVAVARLVMAKVVVGRLGQRGSRESVC